MCARGRDRDRDRDMEREGGREGGRVLRVLPGQVRAQPAPRVAATPIWPAPATETAGPPPDPSRDPLPTLRRPSTPVDRPSEPTGNCPMWHRTANRAGRAGPAQSAIQARPARHAGLDPTGLPAQARLKLRPAGSGGPGSCAGAPGAGGIHPGLVGLGEVGLHLRSKAVKTVKTAVKMGQID